MSACCAWRTSELLEDEAEDSEPWPDIAALLPWSFVEADDCDDEGEDDCDEDGCDEGLDDGELFPCAMATVESDRMAAAMAVFCMFMVGSFRFRFATEAGARASLARPDPTGP